jgi:FkbM family methyltransferase
MRRRAESVRGFFTGGIESRTRMAAQMSGDVLRAIDALERGLDGRNEALSEALRSAAETQSRQIAGRLSDFRADLDMRVASINAAISALASRQSDIEHGVASLLHPETGAFSQVSKALGASSDALKTGFASLSASLRRAMNVQAGQHENVVGGLGDIRTEFAALEAELRTRLAGSASALKAGFGSLADSLRRNLQTNAGGFAMLGGEAGAIRQRLADMEATLSEHVSGAAAQLRMGLSQLAGTADHGARYDELKALIGAIQESGSTDQSQRTRALTLLSGEISAFKSEIEGRISLLGDTTRQFSGTALQMLHAQQDALGEATTRLGILSDGAGKPLTELAELKAMLARTAERIDGGLALDVELLVSAHQKLDASAHRLSLDLDAQTKAIRTSQGFLLVPRLDARLVLMLVESAGAYEPGMSALMGRIVKPGMRVADVGANIGYHTLHLARLVGPRGWVSAIEPIPDLVRMLQRMLALNNVDAFSEVVQAAAGSPAREQNFNIGMTSGHSSLFALPGSTGAITVNVRELDALVPPGTLVDFVKIDAEGAEREVLTGMSGLLRNPDISIAMEFAPSLLRRAGVDPADLLHDIARAGFEIFLINEPDGRLTPVAADPLLAVSGCNIFLVRRHARDWTLVADQPS